jgi:alcohol dehydrogenase
VAGDAWLTARQERGQQPVQLPPVDRAAAQSELVAIEAVGQPETFELAVNLARPGARIANIGVHGKPAALHLEDQWIRDITVTTGLVDTYSTPTLLRLVASDQLDAGKLVTHRFGFDDFEAAYETFSHAADSGALKVVLTP